MSEHFIAKDGICNLRGVHEVHLQQASLEVSLLWQIVFQCFEQELGRLLYHSLRLEDVGDLENGSSQHLQHDLLT